MKPSSIVSLFFLISISLWSCNKDDDLKKNETTTLSFTYNGKQYKFGEHQIGPYGGALGSEQEWIAGEGRIWINRPDIFGGVINYSGPDCTFFSPINNNISNLFACDLTSNMITIDSVAVYFYKSGIHDYSQNQNCFTQTECDILGTGCGPVTYCDAIGTFDLELINKENRIISIKNGKYKYTVRVN